MQKQYWHHPIGYNHLLWIVKIFRTFFRTKNCTHIRFPAEKMTLENENEMKKKTDSPRKNLNLDFLHVHFQRLVDSPIE